MDRIDSILDEMKKIDDGLNEVRNRLGASRRRFLRGIDELRDMMEDAK